MTVAFLIVLIAAVIGSAGMVGVLSWILHRLGRLEAGSPAELQRLISDTAELREQIDAMRSELHTLDERTVFTERLLEGKVDDRSGSPD